MMLRFLNVLAIAALIGSAIYAYSIKYETILLCRADREAAASRSSASRIAIAALRAEWALSDAARTRSGAGRQASRYAAARQQPDRHLGRRILPDQPPKVDTIGRKLEALGLAEPTNTPRDAKASAQRRHATPPKPR